MRLEQSFEVPVPVSQAWSVLLDVERIAPCMPGATLTGYDGTAFTGTVKVKLGPVSLSYKGNGRFVERDEPGKRVAFIASGQDSRGAGGAQARVTAVLHETKGGTITQVKVVADVDIAGRAAQFGRGMIADVSGKLVKQFADCLAQTIAGSPAPAPAAVPSPPPAPVVAAPAPSPEPMVTVPLPEPSPTPVVAAPAPSAEPVVAAPVPESSPEPVVAAAVPSAEPVAPSPASEVEPIPAAEVTEIASPEPGPEYHPLALQEPPEPGTYPEPEPVAHPRTAPIAPPEPAVQPETAYAYAPPPPPPPPAAAAAAPPVPQPSTLSRPQVEAEPIDLLAVSGAKGLARRATPVLIIAAIIVVALIIWLVAR